MDSLLDRYQDKITGVLGCWDRVLVQGTLPGLCYAAGMTAYLNANHIRVFDYPRFAEPLRDQIRENAQSVANKCGVEIEFMRKSVHRKEERIKQVRPALLSCRASIQRLALDRHASRVRDGHRLSSAVGPRSAVRDHHAYRSLGVLQGILSAANHRYLDFISAIDDPSAGNKALSKLCEPKPEHGRNYTGFNFFSAHDQQLLEVLVRGEYNIAGFRNKDLRRHLPFRAGKVSRLLKRLRVHGLIKCVGRTYNYYLTALGRRSILAGLHIRAMILPRMLTAES